MFFRRLADRARRANLLRVLTVYLSACFVALQLVDMFSDRLALPRATFTATLVAGLIGLPIVVFVVLSRVAPAPEEARVRAETHWLTWRRVGFTVVALFALWGVVAAGWLLLGPEESSAKAAVAASGELIVATSPEAEIVATRDSTVHQMRSGDALTLPAGEYLVKISANGFNAVELIAHVDANRKSSYDVQLVRMDVNGKDMVHVQGNDTIKAFLLDKYEVTNEQYLEFIRSGGYRQPALRRFVDSTGSPGPRGWSGGLYAEGTAKHPVVGVSWTEADAYARWRGKQLPTRAQWWHAALRRGYSLPWGADTETINERANFRLESAVAVGSHPRGVSHVGAHDMAGNVREWLRDGSGDARKHVAVGGSWQDPTYLFDPQWSEEFPADFANNFIGFRCVKEM